LPATGTARCSRSTAANASAGRAPTADKKKILDALTPLVEKTGDPVKGKEVYVKNCQVCHAIEGQGGKVGPDLTGIGARPKAEILSEVVDPNRSVEGTYRSWTAETADEESISGRLMSESQTSIEIMDAAGTSHPIQRSELKSLVASEKSVMPEGVEARPEADLKDLMEFMAASSTKH
jgi:hypothetical protein